MTIDINKIPYEGMSNEALNTMQSCINKELGERANAKLAQVRKLVADLPPGWTSWAWPTGVNLFFTVGDLSLAVTFTRVSDVLQYDRGRVELTSDDNAAPLMVLPDIHSPTFPAGQPSIADVLKWAKAQVWMHLLRQAAAFTDKPATPENMEGSLGLSTTDAEADHE
jgi:hypothetical protein